MPAANQGGYGPSVADGEVAAGSAGPYSVPQAAARKGLGAALVGVVKGAVSWLPFGGRANAAQKPEEAVAATPAKERRDTMLPATPSLWPLGCDFTPVPRSKLKENGTAQESPLQSAEGEERGMSDDEEISAEPRAEDPPAERAQEAVASEGVVEVHTSAEFWRVQLEAVYRKRNPYKLDKVPQFLEKYKGQEAVLYKKVCMTYQLDSTKFYAFGGDFPEDEAVDGFFPEHLQERRRSSIGFRSRRAPSMPSIADSVFAEAAACSTEDAPLLEAAEEAGEDGSSAAACQLSDAAWWQSVATMTVSSESSFAATVPTFVTNAKPQRAEETCLPAGSVPNAAALLSAPPPCTTSAVSSLVPPAQKTHVPVHAEQHLEAPAKASREARPRKVATLFEAAAATVSQEAALFSAASCAAPPLGSCVAPAQPRQAAPVSAKLFEAPATMSREVAPAPAQLFDAAPIMGREACAAPVERFVPPAQPPQAAPAPAKHQEAPATVGREAVERRRAPCRTVGQPNSSGFWRQQLEAIYRRLDPYGMEHLHEHLARYRGQEELLYRRVCKAHGLDPSKLYADAAAWAGVQEDFQEKCSPCDGVGRLLQKNRLLGKMAQSPLTVSLAKQARRRSQPKVQRFTAAERRNDENLAPSAPQPRGVKRPADRNALDSAPPHKAMRLPTSTLQPLPGYRLPQRRAAVDVPGRLPAPAALDVPLPKQSLRTTATSAAGRTEADAFAFGSRGFALHPAGAQRLAQPQEAAERLPPRLHRPGFALQPAARGATAAASSAPPLPSATLFPRGGLALGPVQGVLQHGRYGGHHKRVSRGRAVAKHDQRAQVSRSQFVLHEGRHALPATTSAQAAPSGQGGPSVALLRQQFEQSRQLVQASSHGYRIDARAWPRH
eukprot:TRINITY_DN17823_c0_g2_i1.p1 TRINITY_DN17823_c0_g2~~TRINITY_DN17823_c0_g2_i1.p1  ORF type:complete len:892 (-),score=198.20 TRINITY_DN17823_c0_g2_i1:162-2837(-)